MKMSNRIFCVFSLLACVSAGCGGSGLAEPELASVTGVVTVDGAPGANLMITFEPQPKDPKDLKNVGAGSTAQTDEEGTFELNYKGQKGAVVGKHLVRIAAIAGGGPAGGEAAVASSLEIPPRYNAQSDLYREVQKGDNSIDLEISTK
jgi:hypothetical protein